MVLCRTKYGSLQECFEKLYLENDWNRDFNFVLVVSSFNSSFQKCIGLYTLYVELSCNEASTEKDAKC